MWIRRCRRLQRGFRQERAAGEPSGAINKKSALMSPSVVQVSTYDVGGAAIAALRLHTGLGRIGVDSRMMVGHRYGPDNSVVEADRPKSKLAWVHEKLDRIRLKLERQPYARTTSPHLELFSDDRVPGPCFLPEHLPNVDVVN